MLKIRSSLYAFGAAGAVAAALMSWSAPALAQTAQNGGEAYRDGVRLGRTLFDARQCTGSGDYHIGCVDGVDESRFDREADQAMDTVTGDAKPAANGPLLSAPPDLFHQPFSKPGDGTPPNN